MKNEKKLRNFLWIMQMSFWKFSQPNRHVSGSTVFNWHAGSFCFKEYGSVGISQAKASYLGRILFSGLPHHRYSCWSSIDGDKFNHFRCAIASKCFQLIGDTKTWSELMFEQTFWIKAPFFFLWSISISLFLFWFCWKTNGIINNSFDSVALYSEDQSIRCNDWFF